MPPETKSSQKKQASKEKLYSKFKEILTKERLKYLYQFSFVVIVYGILLNYVATILFSYTFGYKLVLAMGIGFYFIKEELPRIIGKCFPPRL